MRCVAAHCDAVNSDIVHRAGAENKIPPKRGQPGRYRLALCIPFTRAWVFGGGSYGGRLTLLSHFSLERGQQFVQECLRITVVRLVKPPPMNRHRLSVFEVPNASVNFALIRISIASRQQSRGSSGRLGVAFLSSGLGGCKLIGAYPFG